MRYKTNKHLEFVKDDLKRSVYVKEKGKDIGMFYWHYKKKKWVYEHLKQQKQQKVIER